MDKFVNGVVEKMIRDGTIVEEDSEIYAFGLRQGIILIINYILTILIGIIMHMFVETLIFMAVYIPLRSFAGGVHAKSQGRCFVYSNLIVIGMLLCIRFFPHNNIGIIAILLCALVVIFFLAPVEDKNKPLDEREVKVYGRKARRFAILYGAIVVLCSLFKWWMPEITVALTLGCMAVVLILGKLKNNIIDKKNL